MVVEGSAAKDIDTFELVFDFVKSIQFNNKGIWKDGYGITVISIGKNPVSELLKKLNRQPRSYGVLLSPIIEERVNVPPNCNINDRFLWDVEYILSIGGAREHNVAKEFLSKTNNVKRPKLITVPVPLTNDSFCTNRSSPCFGRVKVPSRETLYPSEIIIDFNLLDSIDERLNVVGIGEVIGLYYSLRDYYSMRKLPMPESLISNIEKGIHNLMLSLKNEKVIWFKCLGINLIAKCLIMRVAEDNQIGAGGDHLLAYALEYICENANNCNDRKLSHGELVYLGSLGMAALFPEWKYKFFSLKNLLDFGKATGLLKGQNLNLLVNALKNELISIALRMRANRPTVLSILSAGQIKKGWMRLNTC